MKKFALFFLVICGMQSILNAVVTLDKCASHETFKIRL